MRRGYLDTACLCVNLGQLLLRVVGIIIPLHDAPETVGPGMLWEDHHTIVKQALIRGKWYLLLGPTFLT